MRSLVCLMVVLGLGGLPPLIAGCGAEPSEEEYADARRRMVREQLQTRDITSTRVLEAMARVRRHRFMAEADRRYAYRDHPYSIGSGQTISQPYIVALMAQLAELTGRERVLEVGTGSGYGAAVLSACAASVYSVELLPELARMAAVNLREEGFDTTEVRCSDGYRGWPEAAPFDAIVVTCAPPRIPEPLLEQLAEGGRLVVPVGEVSQTMTVYRKRGGRVLVEPGIPVRFVPMRGDVEQRK